ncbi:MAG: spermidine/putrescine ABC transporter substrate-binding protein, partial [Actinobacteria bacterium]|nr:spermidine/putrescine ABC transporter substrate-binding protein [Actinomycetota bacterium]
MTRRLSRREFVSRSLVVGGGSIALAHLLSACGGGNESTTQLVIGTPDAPVTLPTVGEPIADGLPLESGTLQIYNYADYLNPETIAAFEAAFGVKVTVSIYDTEEVALSKMRSGSIKPDLVLGLTDSVLARFVAAELLQPLNRGYIGNFENVIAGLRDPYYDLGAQYTIPYVIYGNGIGYRTDRDIDKSVFVGNEGWSALWNPAYAGRLAVLDSYRDTISMALFRAGVFDPNTSDASALSTAVDDLVELATLTNPKIDILSYQEIAGGGRDIALCWSGDMLAGVGYLPEGESPDVLGFWYPEVTPTANDFFSIPRASTKPVLAHAFINYLLDTEVALGNQAYVGYQPALEALTAEALV